MNAFHVFLIAGGVVLALTLLFAVYFVVYKNNINKALKKGGKPPVRMLSPYRVLMGLCVFLISVAVTATSVSGVNMSANYSAVMERSGRNLATRMIEVTYLPQAGIDAPLRRPQPANAAEIAAVLERAERLKGFGVVPVVEASMYVGLDAYGASLFAVDAENARWLGLDSMEDDVAYMFSAPADEIELQLNVVTFEENGVVADEMAYYPLKTDAGLSNTMLAHVVAGMPLRPREQSTIMYVTFPTLCNILSVCLQREAPDGVKTVDEAMPYLGAPMMFVCAESIMDVNAMKSALESQGYVAYGPIKETTDYFESVTLLFRALCVSGAALACIAGVNVFLSVKNVSLFRERKKADNA